MEAKKFYNRNLAIWSLMLFSCFMWSCDREDDEISLNLVTFNDVKLSGEHEVPANASDGYGVFNGVYDKNANVMTFNVTWRLGKASDKTVGMHFHGPALPTENAPVVVGVSGFTENAAGTYSGRTRKLTDAEEKELLSGKWYYNIHSSSIPSGELRGNLLRR